MTPPRIRVLIVDDSAFARKVVRETLAADPRLEVVGFARDGLDALEKIAELTPDVITLDLMMPELDGLGVLAALAERRGGPRVVVVTTAEDDSERGLAALDAGAFDLVHKPTALATDRLYTLGAELIEKVVAAGRGSPGARAARLPAPVQEARPPGRVRALVIGASTGGPRAVSELLAALPTSIGVPIGIVLHMPPGYTEPFARRLDRALQFEVCEAREGMVFQMGRVIVARAGVHLKVVPGGEANFVAHLDVSPVESLHRPSVDELFISAAAAWGDGVLAVVLTGMGSDGLEGSRAVRAAGGRVLAEAASSCVVWGMPRAVSEAGLAEAQPPLDLMARAIVDRL